MTPAEPDQGVPGTTRARLRAAALGVVGALLLPLPAAAAPAPCEKALRYAAQSGAQLMRIATLDLGPVGRDDKPVKNVGVGDAKSALVAQSPVNAAALGRILDGGPANRKALAEVLQQTAPPAHKRPEQRKHKATEVGPFSLGASRLTVRAQWEPGMACGNTAGEATRSKSDLGRAGVLQDGDAALVRVPGKLSSLSTTAMERRGPAARAVAAASMAGGKIQILGGAVTIKVVKPPSLLAMMSGADGGEVRYKPAVIEVSGDGFETERLDAAGDNVELRLDEDGTPMPDQDDAAQDDAAQDDAAQDDAAQDDAGPEDAGEAEETAGAGGASIDNVPKTGASISNPDNDGNARTSGELFAVLPATDALESAAPLPLPNLPGVPPLAEPGSESAPVAAPGTTVMISLGDVRQAVDGHAIAAKATAMNIMITKGPDRQAYAGSAPTRSGVVLDLDMGLLEAAAVAPEPAADGASRGVSDSAGGLPITGPRVDVHALAGVALLIAGAAALIFGLRARSGF